MLNRAMTFTSIGVMRRFLYFLFSLVVLCACGKKEVNQPVPKKTAENIAVHRILDNLFPLDSMETIDENNLLFNSEARWDTSFILLLKKDTSLVKGVYYEILPGDDLSFTNGTTLFFTSGFSFNADTALWTQVIAHSRTLLDTTGMSKEYGGWMDTGYLMAHNHILVREGQKGMRDFESFKTFLKKEVINPFKAKRQKRN